MIKSLFLLIGAPGSGKTTVAEILANEDKDVAHYSTGELLRNEVKSGSKLGKTIENLVVAIKTKENLIGNIKKAKIVATNGKTLIGELVE